MDTLAHRHRLAITHLHDLAHDAEHRADYRTADNLLDTAGLHQIAADALEIADELARIAERLADTDTPGANHLTRAVESIHYGIANLPQP